MGLLVEFRIGGDAIEATEVAAATSATLEIEEWRIGDEAVHWFVWARGGDRARVGDAFATLSHVKEVVTVSDGEAACLYRVSTDREGNPPDQLLRNGAMLEGYVREDGIHVTAQVADRSVVRDLWAYLRERGVTLETKRLQRTTEGDTNGRLTDPQFEALATAYEMGYFDESTRVTQSEIAAELDISRPSFSERLRRAEQRLVEKRLVE